MKLSAIDDNGKPVDWWFAYKVAGKSSRSETDKAKATLPDGSPVTGTEYVYFDSNMPEDGKLVLSPHKFDEGGALPNTLAQVYVEEGLSTQHAGWFFYNDENPIDGTVNGTLGHTKGVLAFDLGTDTGFWLIQSTPKFPPADSYAFPHTGMPNAQTLLCITLSDASVAESICRQMFAAHQPNVYHASKIPVDLENHPNDPRVELMNKQVMSGNSPVHAAIPFQSAGGVKFTSIAKNKFWGLDFYNDLVGPTLHEDLDVETWGHGTTPPADDNDKIHTCVDMTGIDLNPLGYTIAWPEPNDHAKLAISARSESDHYVCVGDINFTVSMRKRSGGTVAFQCDALWASLSSILTGVTAGIKPGSLQEANHVARRSASSTAQAKAATRAAAKAAAPKTTTRARKAKQPSAE